MFLCESAVHTASLNPPQNLFYLNSTAQKEILKDRQPLPNPCAHHLTPKPCGKSRKCRGILGHFDQNTVYSSLCLKSAQALDVEKNRIPRKCKKTLSYRAGGKCSNPDCGKSTLGAHSDSEKFTTIGQAAHIHAARPGGPRANINLDEKELKKASNGIWLCGIAITWSIMTNQRIPWHYCSSGSGRQI